MQSEFRLGVKLTERREGTRDPEELRRILGGIFPDDTANEIFERLTSTEPIKEDIIVET